ncbi:ornithine cyclodeaminase family protein [Alphaproteobacteria bacterium]|nr:ornithine cyclodeaminase family protein [Alphaproteobacteria bacterium]
MPLVITDDDARRLLPMEECIDAMRVCFRDFADGEAVSLPRVRYVVDTPNPGKSYYANVHVGAVPSFGMACVRAGTHLIEEAGYEDNRRRMSNLEPFNWTVVLLYDIATSEPVAFMHESYVSGIRVGATSGAAVAEVAREDASTLGLLGTGRQAAAHMEAICAVRPIIRVNVYSPNEKHLDEFVARTTHDGVEIMAVKQQEDVVRGADIICCATNTTTPVLFGDSLEDGQMVISIVNSDATGTRREVDDATLARSTDIIINDWDSVHANNQIELLEPIEKGLVDKDHVHLLGDVLKGGSGIKSGQDGIVYYKNNTGLAMQFAAAGAIIYPKLLAEGTNRVIPREWLASEQYGIG